MDELWADLDKLKEQMAEELKEFGIYDIEPKKDFIIPEYKAE